MTQIHPDITQFKVLSITSYHMDLEEDTASFMKRGYRGIAIPPSLDIAVGSVVTMLVHRDEQEEYLSYDIKH